MGQEVLNVKNILDDYFGEENVDIQKTDSYYEDRYTCIIKQDSVKVTNEFDYSHIIKGVYIKFVIDTSGKLKSSAFSLGRNIYSYKEYMAGYKFSHCPSFGNGAENTFSDCCLGRGPIRDTIASLSVKSTDSLWMLFCRQLDQYIHTESISGGPYIRMQDIDTRSTNYTEKINLYKNYYTSSNSRCDNIFKSLIQEFVDYITPNIFSNFTFIRTVNGYYRIKQSDNDIIIIFSREFINYINNMDINTKNSIINSIKENREATFNLLYNEYDTTDILFLKILIQFNILLGYNIYNGNLIKKNTITSPSNNKLCTFKGKDIITIIEDGQLNKVKENYVLSPNIISPIINSYESYVNYYISKNNPLKYEITI